VSAPAPAGAAEAADMVLAGLDYLAAMDPPRSPPRPKPSACRPWSTAARCQPPRGPGYSALYDREWPPDYN
jgi:hypothetical protein